MSNLPLRYVVLHHTGIDDPHFDLMVERSAGSALATWRCKNWPPDGSDSFFPLGDHRQEYLDYEGPILGGRGHVSLVMRGQCKVVESNNSKWLVEFDSGRTILLLCYQRK